ncbi:MAG: hypothetical protein ACRDV0_10235 [Acidimicrobiales bacterium]
MVDATDEFDAASEIALLRETPVEVILGNHLLHLLQLATVHLASEPPNLDAARVAIDVVAAMVSAGGERLGEHVGLYRSALAEVQGVFVRAATPPADGHSPVAGQSEDASTPTASS